MIEDKGDFNKSRKTLLAIELDDFNYKAINHLILNGVSEFEIDLNHLKLMDLY